MSLSRSSSASNLPVDAPLGAMAVQVTPQDGEELLRCVDAMTPEQLEALRRKLSAMDSAAQAGKESADGEGAVAGTAGEE